MKKDTPNLCYAEFHLSKMTVEARKANEQATYLVKNPHGTKLSMDIKRRKVLQTVSLRLDNLSDSIHAYRDIVDPNHLLKNSELKDQFPLISEGLSEKNRLMFHTIELRGLLSPINSTV